MHLLWRAFWRVCFQDRKILACYWCAWKPRLERKRLHFLCIRLASLSGSKAEFENWRSDACGTAYEVSQFCDVQYLFQIIMFLILFLQCIPFHDFSICFPLAASKAHSYNLSSSALTSCLPVKHTKTHTLAISVFTSLLRSIISGQSRSEVFIFSRPITKQLVLPDIERHFECECPSPGPCSI